MGLTELASPGTKVKLGGKDRTLRFDANAFLEIEKVTGKNPFEDKDLLAVSPGSLRNMIWGALYGEDPRPSLEDVGSWLSLQNMGELQLVVASAQRRSLPDLKPGAKPGPRKSR